MNYIIEPLDKYPGYAPICAHWSFCQWYLKRGVPFKAVINDYKSRTKSTDLPITYIAVHNSVPIGMATLNQDDLWNRKELGPWLASLYVLPDFRKNGVGKDLVQAIITEATKRNFKNIYLFLGQYGQEALKDYYGDVGWKFFESPIDNDGNETKILEYKIVE